MNAAALAVPISLPLKFQAEHFGHRRTVYDTEFSACSMYSAAIPISNQKDKEGKQGWVALKSYPQCHGRITPETWIWKAKTKTKCWDCGWCHGGHEHFSRTVFVCSLLVIRKKAGWKLHLSVKNVNF